MMRTRIRLIIALTFTTVLVAGIGYEVWRKQAGAEDIFSMQGVKTCNTDRDFQSGSRSCPREQRYITTCEEAREAIASLSGVILASDIGKVVPGATDSLQECELKTINADKKLYALVFHAYSSTTPLKSGTESARTQALNTLYSRYANLYQSHLALDYPTAPLREASSSSSILQAFAPAFLVTGEPGFRMSVSLEQSSGDTLPGGGTLIGLSCNGATDIMTAEPNGTSWFSFEGYEKLNCGREPLTAQVLIPKDASGNWMQGPSYSYLYEPAGTTLLTFQNRSEPIKATFTGKWQGLSAQVTAMSWKGDGTTFTNPIANTEVAFSCEGRLASPLLSVPTERLTAKTNDQGLATLSLADAKANLPGCTDDQFRAALTAYDTRTQSWNPSDPTFDFSFTSPGPVMAGRTSGTNTTGGELTGYELVVGGRVTLTDKDGVPGGYFTGGSTICLFLNSEAASTTSGCPKDRTATSLTTRADDQGRFAFGGTSDQRISYGTYKNTIGKPVVRILNYKDTAYPDDVAANNTTNLKPTEFNNRTITLPTSEGDLKDHLCLLVKQTWGNTRECDPLFSIIERESRYKVNATNPTSGAYGMFQALPPEKYRFTAIPDEDYKSIGNQLRWGVSYIEGRYNTPTEAWRFWQANHYY